MYDVQTTDRPVLLVRTGTEMGVNRGIIGFLCPCCGFLTRDREELGSFEICPVCFWEDDDLQAENTALEGGSNKVNLITAKENFLKFGAVEQAYADRVRPPTDQEIPNNGHIA